MSRHFSILTQKLEGILSMTMLLAVLLGTIAVPAIQTAAPPRRASDAVDQARSARLDKAIETMMAKRNDTALALLDPLIAEYDALYAKEKRRIFCAGDGAETIFYMAMAAGGKPAQDAVAINPEWCLALWAKGYTLIDMGRIADSIPWLERAVAMRPHRSQYLSELGYAHQALKNWPTSIEMYTRAAEAADVPGDRRVAELGRAWFGIAYSKIELGEWDEAAALLKQCIDLDPSNQKYRSELQYVNDHRPKTT